VLSVYTESGKKRVFAGVVDWPGWCRAGRDEAHALDALATARGRYALIAKEAGMRLPAADFEVVERIAGSMTTDFGAPGSVPALDLEPLKKAEAERLARLVEASWAVFDGVVATAPAELRKGPRGGGRDRDKIVEHVLGAEVAYASKIGVRHRQPARDDAQATAAHRAAIVEALRNGAWHVLDHAWEIEDRTEPPA
jgi:hypothetical protein